MRFSMKMLNIISVDRRPNNIDMDEDFKPHTLNLLYKNCLAGRESEAEEHEQSRNMHVYTCTFQLCSCSSASDSLPA